MADRKFVRKLNILELVEEMEIIGRMSLVDNFDISYRGQQDVYIDCGRLV